MSAKVLRARVSDVRESARWLRIIAESLPADTEKREERAADLFERARRMAHLAKHFGRLQGEYFEQSLNLFPRRRRTLSERVASSEASTTPPARDRG